MAGEGPDRRCPKCGGREIDIRGVRTTGSGLSRWFNYQRNKFIVVSCQHCGYSEFYYDDGREETDALALFGREHSPDTRVTDTGSNFRRDAERFWESEGWTMSEHEPAEGVVLFSGTRSGEIGEQTGLLLVVADRTQAVTEALVTDLEKQRRDRGVDIAAVTGLGGYTDGAREQIDQYGIRRIPADDITAAGGQSGGSARGAAPVDGPAAGPNPTASTQSAGASGVEQSTSDDSGGLVTRRGLLLLALLPATWVGTYAYSQIQPNDSGGTQADNAGQIDMQVGRGSTRATNEAIIVEVPVENRGTAPGTVEFTTTLLLDGEQHSTNRHTVTVEGGGSRTVESSHGVGRLESFTSETYRHSVNVLDQYPA